MRNDLRFAWRALWKSPTTTLGAMLALALGIGATTTMFGLLNAVSLRPLPYPESDRLVELWGNVERQTVERRGTSIPDYLDWKAKSRSFDLMSAWSDGGFIMYGSGAPERIGGETVAGEYFATLGIEPILGRALNSADDAADVPLVAVIGEQLWSRAYGRAPNVIGQSPSTAIANLINAGFQVSSEGDLSTGTKGKVQAQNPDHTECLPAGTLITIHWRPL